MRLFGNAVTAAFAMVLMAMAGMLAFILVMEFHSNPPKPGAAFWAIAMAMWLVLTLVVRVVQRDAERTPFWGSQQG